MMKKIKIILIGLIIGATGGAIFSSAQAISIAEHLSGKILLQVEDNGEAWYIYPANNKRYYLGRPSDAFNLMRNLGLGIRHSELENYQNSFFPARLSGMILLDVERNGEAYYINPDDFTDYYLGRPQDAFRIMRELSLGITNVDLEKIEQTSSATVEESSPTIVPPAEIEDPASTSTPNIQELGTPDLTISNITAGGLGFSGYLNVSICNEGERFIFDNLKLRLNEHYKVIQNLTLDAGECYPTGYYARIADKIGLFDVVNSWTDDGANVSVQIDPDNEIEELDETNNQLAKDVAIPTCGNNICEEGENQGNCPFDCEIPCESNFCNEKVVVFCGCDHREYLLNECIFSEPCAENQCQSQEGLFDEVLQSQTSVYDCLADYFNYNPSRIPYIIYAEKTDVCDQEGGCPRPNSSTATNVYYIINPSLPGFVSYGEIYTNKVEQLVVDEHEMTHHFLNQMLHSIPDWFSEGVAIQTDARINCDVSSHPLRSGIGYEKTLESAETDIDNPRGSGFWLNDDGSILFNEGFYQDLKEGLVSINETLTPAVYDLPGRRDPHIIGSLFMMGLKLDYNCTENCVRDIIKELKDFEEQRCPGPNCGIRLALGAREGEEGINNSILKEKINKVLGQDTTPLFELLELK